MKTLTLEDLSEPVEPSNADWNDEGVVVIPDMIPVEMIEAYQQEWMAANGFRTLDEWRDVLPRSARVLYADEPGGFEDCTPYMRYPALREMCCYGPLAEALESLTGEPMGVHLNLTGWVSTERNYHQDTYLNPEGVGDHYAAVWIALGDVHPDSGPFQYIPGSHRWHRLLRERIWGHVDRDDPQWPKHTEDFLTPMVEAEIERRGVEVVSHLPKRGDVLIWHSRLYHRGSKANLPGAYRPALIAHYSSVFRRPDMPVAVQHEAGGFYFPIESSGPVR